MSARAGSWQAGSVMRSGCLAMCLFGLGLGGCNQEPGAEIADGGMQQDGALSADLAPAPPRSTCADQLLDGDEVDVDCGGSCAACGAQSRPTTVRIHALLVSDDDGGRPCPITATEIRTWVDKANEIWAGAAVTFQFDPRVDTSALKSTLLNGMAGNGDVTWLAERAFARQVAAQHPGRALVVFRFGPGPGATGGGFSWYDLDFVAAPGRVTSVCGHQNVGLLAHELGHYFGLAHTFAAVFKDEKEAADYLGAHGGNGASFDGDGLADTLPDPFVSLAQYQCDQTPELNLGGTSFQLPRDNIMSYYEPRTGLSPSQIARARFVLETRLRQGMLTPDNHGAVTPSEADELVISEHQGVSTGPQDMAGFGGGWTGDRHLFCDFQPGGRLSLQFNVASAERFSVDVYATRAPDFGRFRVSLDDLNLGVLDAWAPLVIPTGRVALGVHALAPGAHRITFESTGKNAKSTGTKLGVDCLDINPAP